MPQRHHGHKFIHGFMVPQQSDASVRSTIEADGRYYLQAVDRDQGPSEARGPVDLRAPGGRV